MFSSKACYMSLLLLAACTALAHCGVLEASLGGQDAYAPDAAEEKNSDAMQVHKRPSFFVGSRYGRSGSNANAPMYLAPSKARRLNMVPRNDRFFLGSRYGKRAGEYMSPYEQDNNNAAAAAAVAASNAHMGLNKSLVFGGGDNDAVVGAPAPPSTTPYMMSCVYTGLRNLYRCNSVEEINNIINQLTTAQNDDDM